MRIYSWYGTSVLNSKPRAVSFTYSDVYTRNRERVHVEQIEIISTLHLASHALIINQSI